jgi:tRNA modification GTPase
LLKNNELQKMDTIFALATAHGKAGVAIVRISGPKAWEAGLLMCETLPSPRVAGLRLLTDMDGQRLDEALVIAFPNTSSFTGEYVLELHLHGSTAVVSAVLHFLAEIPDFRMAEAGEFTRRALENGRLDLSQVEGLADLIDAETEAQRKQAQRVLSGELGKRADEWRVDLIRAAALLEATIDFADEDVPIDVTPEVRQLISGVLKSIKTEILGVDVAERVRSGFEVAIIGAPNVGNSTLLNALAGREAAVTSEFAGTTRDIIEVRMDLGGLPVTLLDTAGLRASDDYVESIGIELAKSRAETADIRVFLVEEGCQPELAVRAGDIVLRAKGDLLANTDNAISGTTGLGVNNLIQNLSKTLEKRVASVGIATRECHRMAMKQATLVLSEAQTMLSGEYAPTDIIAEEIRTGIRALDALVGRVDVENLLDEIFTSFCIGK